MTFISLFLLEIVMYSYVISINIINTPLLIVFINNNSINNSVFRVIEHIQSRLLPLPDRVIAIKPRRKFQTRPGSNESYFDLTRYKN